MPEKNVSEDFTILVPNVQYAVMMLMVLMIARRETFSENMTASPDKYRV